MMRVLAAAVLMPVFSGCVGRNFIEIEFIGWTAAAGAVKITPSRPVSMGGYSGGDRVSAGVHDDIYARCLILRFGDSVPLVLVSLDLIGLLRHDVLLIKDLVLISSKEALGQNSDSIFICATHQHSGPDTLGVFGGRDEDYMKELREKIASLIETTLKNLRPATIWLGATESNGLSKNWRVPEEVDEVITVLRVLESVGRREHIATLVHFACHPEALGRANRLITADFPGQVVERLERRWGGTAMFFNGLLGGMVSLNPEKFNNKDHGFELMREAGDALADRITRRTPNDIFLTAREIELRRSEAAIRLDNAAFKRLIECGRVPYSPATYADGKIITEISALRIGQLTILFVPGEMTPGLGFQIKKVFRESSDQRVLIFGLANDEIGYILPPEDFDLPLYSHERELSAGQEAGRKIREGLTQ